MPCSHSWRWSADDPGVRRLGLGVAALLYASLGYSVLPLVPGGKRPHPMLGDQGGVWHASVLAELITDWWTADPAANIGVATGRMSHLAVIDLDVKHCDGPGSFRQFMSDCGDRLDGYPVASTPSGGWHIWLRQPGGLPERPGILPGVDVKGDGGLVVAPPSGVLVMPLGTDGERVAPLPVAYSWEYGCPCSAPLAPGWLLPWTQTAPSARPVAGTQDSTPGGADDLAQTGIARGARNHVLYRTACGLYRKYGTSPAGAAAVVQRLQVIWAAGDRTDFPWSELLTVAESARRFIEREQQRERQELLAAAPWLRRYGG